MIVCYIAAKYNAKTDGERLRNTERVIDVGIQVYEKSNHEIYPHIPHLTHYIEKRMDYLGMKERDNEYWYNFDNLILPKCDVLLMLEEPKVSKGADLEVELAKKLKIPVVCSVYELLRLYEEMKDYSGK